MLTRLWSQWKQFAQKVADFQARVLLTLIYFLILGLFGAVVTVFGDPLAIKRLLRSSLWLTKPIESASLEQARRQF